MVPWNHDLSELLQAVAGSDAVVEVHVLEVFHALAVGSGCFAITNSDIFQAIATLRRAGEFVRIGFLGLDKPAVTEFVWAAVNGSDMV